GDDEVDALIDGWADLVVACCSAAASHAAASRKAGIFTTLTAFPPALTVGPEYGLVVLKNTRDAGSLYPVAGWAEDSPASRVRANRAAQRVVGSGRMQSPPPGE